MLREYAFSGSSAVMRSWIEKAFGGWTGSWDKSVRPASSNEAPWAMRSCVLTMSTEQIDSVMVCSTWSLGLISRKKYSEVFGLNKNSNVPREAYRT